MRTKLIYTVCLVGALVAPVGQAQDPAPPKPGQGLAKAFEKVGQPIAPPMAPPVQAQPNGDPVAPDPQQIHWPFARKAPKKSKDDPSGEASGMGDHRLILILCIGLGVLAVAAMVAVVARNRSLVELVPRRQSTSPLLPDEDAPKVALATAALMTEDGGSKSPPAQFFLGRRTTVWHHSNLCRVYVSPEELLLLSAGPEDPGRNATGAAASGGLFGFLIGGLVAKAQRRQLEARREQLDRADPVELVRLASAEAEGFRAAIAEVESARVEMLTSWQKLFTRRAVGRLHLDLGRRGKVQLDLPSGLEVRLAIERLVPLLGDRLTINVVWDPYSQRFVRKPLTA
jgi:hypothetical protein